MYYTAIHLKFTIYNVLPHCVQGVVIVDSVCCCKYMYNV